LMYGRPIVTGGVVTYYDSEWKLLFLQDDSVGIFVLPQQNLKLQPGDLVRVKGKAASSNIGIANPEFTIVNRGHLLPNPSLVQLSGGGDDYRFLSRLVTVQGVVRSAEVRDARYTIVLGQAHRNLLIRVLQSPGQDFAIPIDSVVSVTGVCGAVVNDRGMITGVQVFASSVESISLLSRGQPDPFALPLTDATRLHESAASGRAIHIRGRVTKLVVGDSEAQSSIEIQVGAIRYKVLSDKAIQFRVGDAVELVGFLTADGPPYTIADTLIRPANPSTRQVPVVAETRHTAIAEIKRLRYDDMLKQRRERVRGTVTYYDAIKRFFYVQDGTAGVYVDLNGQSGTVMPGDVVEISAEVVSGGFAPILKDPHITYAGRDRLPKPQHLLPRPTEIASAAGTLITTESVVRSVHSDHGHLLLDIGSGSDRVIAEIPSSNKAAFSGLVDAEIEVTGVADVLLNARQQPFGVCLHVPSTSFIRVMQAYRAEPFAGPTQKISNVLRFAEPTQPGHRVKVRGIVDLVRSDGSFFAQDSTGGILVQSSESEPARLGDEIEAVGFPSVSAYSPSLVSSVLRRVGHAPVPEPHPINSVQALSGAYDSDLVVLTGTVNDVRSYGSHRDLLMESNGVPFDVEVDTPHGSAWRGRPSKGSVLEIVGVCLVEVDGRAMGTTPTSFRILASSPSSITILRPGPWLTIRRAVGFGTSAVLLAGIAALWALALRVRVNSKTREVRKSLEAQLAVEQRYKEIFENASDIILTADCDGRITSVNPAAEKITGYSMDHIMQTGLSTFLGPDYAEYVAEHYRTSSQMPLRCFQVQVIGRHGNTVALDVNTQPMQRAGEPVGVQIVARDITEKQRLEAHVQHSQKMDAIGALAGGVAHDFNNFLMVISSNLELLEESLPANASVQKYADGIKNAVKRATSVTTRLLAYTRKQFVSSEIFSVHDMIVGVSDLLRMLCNGHVQLKLESDPTAGTVKGDKAQLEQVLVNLVTNARDSIAGSGTITISTRSIKLANDLQSQSSTLRAGDYLVLSVTDTGCGIPDSTRSRIFEPFFTTKARGKGTGLGLSMVYSIVSQIGGQINVESSVGRGTTFHVYLPQSCSIRALPARSERNAAVKPASKRILIVDDEELLRHVASEFLESKGYDTCSAGSGEEALLLLENEEEFDILLTDIVMPGMSGKDLATLAVQRWPHMSVIYMSGFTDGLVDLDQSHARFLRKPFSLAALLKTVQSVSFTSTETRAAEPLAPASISQWANS
jgi:PAS domain S-box-containing protein